MSSRDLKDELKKAAATIEGQNDTIISLSTQLDEYESLVDMLVKYDPILGNIIDNHFNCEECSL